MVVEKTVPPLGWTQKRLGDVCRTVGGGTPSRSQPKYWNGEIPWASVKDFTDDCIILTDTQEHITQDGLESSPSTLVPKDTPLLCTRMAVGRCALTARPTAINQDLKALLLSEDFDLRYFIRLLKFHARRLERLSIGSTVRGITTSDLLGLQLCFAKKPEQARIALVLDTVDELIAKTEAVIAKLRQVRAGLLHDLLTRGLDAHGQLRPPPSQAPHLYKPSPLGMIPKEWEVQTLGLVCKPQQWPTISTNELTLTGFPVFGANGQIGFYTSFNHETPCVAITCRGATCGTIHVTPPQCYITGNAMALDNLDEEQVRLRFLAEFLRMRGLRDCITGSAQPQIIRATLLNIPIPKPCPEEQDAVITILSTHDSHVKSEECVLSKLHHLKSGLMDDLLTGRVRVPESLDGSSKTM